ncbi:DNA glycosylase [Halteromyces radiatus]|uniref:DNA glycosylase n=1 Tax=Halteromyces radiatus TaxID=101107 RepID=UPI00222015AA|nr:DNA glycosylase [Halteromyces radiatus]KAI8079964.1 DNA glycosylase [Halteromyces radiatus]
MDDRAFKEFQQRIKLADGSNPFKSLVTSIIFQQIHGKAAASIRNRFLRSFESPIPFPADEILPSSFPWFPTPDMILAKTTEELRSVGLSQRKTEYIQDLSAKFANNTIVSEELDRMSDETISKLLCSVKGIGQWTVDMFLMFNLCHPDVLPVSDLGVRKGVALHFNTGNKKDKKNQIILPSPDEMRQLTEKWKPYRTLGSWMMWRLMEIKTVADD